MTLFWGQTCRVLSPRGENAKPVAAAMLRVLREHVAVQTKGEKMDVQIHLAPGAMPVLAENGQFFAPFAHRYENSFALTALAMTGRWDSQTVGATLRAYVDGLHRPSAAPWRMDVELHRYLQAVETAGHLDTYAHWVMDPAFGDSYTGANQAAVTGMLSYFDAHPFKPTVAVLPDDLALFTP